MITAATEQNIAQNICIIISLVILFYIYLYIYTIKMDLLDQTESISNAYTISLAAFFKRKKKHNKY